MALQDRWLGEVISLLEKHRRLEQTILVFTADHGMRNRIEDPELTIGTLSADSFHVPLVIFAPRAYGQRLDVATLTSHIDVVPTLLDLLGIKEGRDWEQGSWLDDPRLADRATFFLANHSNGVDGFHQRGQFQMWQHVTGQTARSDQFQFSPGSVLPAKGDSAHETHARLQSFTALQKAWVRQAIRSGPVIESANSRSPCGIATGLRPWS